ncbi:hypothetical protein D6D17_10654 [Aureobasidium pullulans]|nr:hypothetical protein D6D17_10654 [Aureobasidium pullulans]
MKVAVTLSALVSVVPTILAAQAYLPYARYGGDPSTDRVINAVDGRFYVGRQTTFIPPPWGLDNPETYNHHHHRSHRRQPLVDGRPAARRTEVLEDGNVKLVNVEAKGEGSVAPTVDWSACQSGDDDYAVYSGGLLRCHAFEMVLKVTDAAAPQYYHYWDE